MVFFRNGFRSSFWFPAQKPSSTAVDLDTEEKLQSFDPIHVSVMSVTTVGLGDQSFGKKKVEGNLQLLGF